MGGCAKHEVAGYLASALQGYARSCCRPFAAHVVGSDAPLSLVLLIRPENVSICQLSSNTDNEYGAKLDRSVLDMITGSAITNEDDLIRLNLTLHAPGRVICPIINLPIPPVELQHSGLVAFSRLCHTVTVCIYLAKSRIPSLRDDTCLNMTRPKHSRHVMGLGEKTGKNTNHMGIYKTRLTFSSSRKDDDIFNKTSPLRHIYQNSRRQAPGDPIDSMVAEDLHSIMA